MTNRTQSSGETGGVPRGSKTEIMPNDDAETTRGKTRENESAEILAGKGYNIELAAEKLPYDWRSLTSPLL